MFLRVLILPICVPVKNIDAPVPSAGITTFNSAPEPESVGPRIPGIPSTSITPVVYPEPGSIRSTSLIVPESVSASIVTVILHKPPSPSPTIGTCVYTPGAYSVPPLTILIFSILRSDATSEIIGSFL